MPEVLIKIKYVDEDPMNLAGLSGKPKTVNKDDVLEFPKSMAEAFLRDTKTILKEKKKPEKDKEGNIVKPGEYEPVQVPKWARVEDKGGK